LQPGTYRVRDYENDRDVATVSGPTARITVTFKRHLLLEASPN
jgi:hypothetical protein